MMSIDDTKNKVPLAHRIYSELSPEEKAQRNVAHEAASQRIAEAFTIGLNIVSHTVEDRRRIIEKTLATQLKKLATDALATYDVIIDLDRTFGACNPSAIAITL